MEPTTIEGWKAFVYDQSSIIEQAQRNIQIANQKIVELSKTKDKKNEPSRK